VIASSYSVFFLLPSLGVRVPLPYCFLVESRLILMNSSFILQQQQQREMQVASYAYTCIFLYQHTHTHTETTPWSARGSSSASYENANCFLLESLTHQSLALRCPSLIRPLSLLRQSWYSASKQTQRSIDMDAMPEEGYGSAKSGKALFGSATAPIFRSWASKPIHSLSPMLGRPSVGGP
jgi:hypothetical protein